jgi:hypothetical protein
MESIIQFSIPNSQECNRFFVNAYGKLLLMHSQKSKVWYIPALTSDSAPAPFEASASSVMPSPYWRPAFYGFDQNVDTHWHASHGYGCPQWLRIKLDKAISIYKYSLTPRYDPDHPLLLDGPIDFIIQGSNDGSNWVTIDTQTGLTNGWLLAVKRDFAIPPTNKYQYYRLYITKFGRNTSGAGTLSVIANTVNIGEFQIYQYK